jgi:hypothetical protein
MRQREPAFVDSGAWIALALSRDPLPPQAREQWEVLQGTGARLHASVPVGIETFTFLDRYANRDVALAWKDSISEPRTVKVLPCDLHDLRRVVDILPPPRPAQALGRRCEELRHHETIRNPPRLRLRSSLRDRRVPAGSVMPAPIVLKVLYERTSCRRPGEGRGPS